MSFKINRVYTRSGDQGLTGLVDGSRVPKSDLRVRSYGEIDELNSVIGCLKEEINNKKLFELLEFIQQELFDIGSELATSVEYPNMWKCNESNVEQLEKNCDLYGDGLEELDSFILPGGSKSAAWLHVARCVARRAEREIVLLQEREKGNFNQHILKYINRLSDLMFILARFVLKEEGKQQPLWSQVKSRKLPS